MRLIGHDKWHPTTTIIAILDLARFTVLAVHSGMRKSYAEQAKKTQSAAIAAKEVLLMRLVEAALSWLCCVWVEDK
jgi:hypothetical protein